MIDGQIPNEVRQLSDAQWLEYLIQSIKQREFAGIVFPGFPPQEIQSQFTGSANEQTLTEAFNFYDLLKKYALALGRPLHPATKALDFGIGWGRFMRFLWKDVWVENLYGCDIDPDIIKLCRELGVPGHLSQIFNGEKLPYPDQYFDCILSYSVFTHLPEDVHVHWMQEMARVAKPGCVVVFTLEPRRFIDFVGSLKDDTKITSNWHKFLATYSDQVADLYKKFDAGDIAYIASGGGAHRENTVYGDAIVPVSFLDREWGKHFERHAYIDDPKNFWQAVVVMRKL